MERHPRTSPIGGSAPALVPRPQAQARALARTHAQLWRTRAGQREGKDGGAQLPNAAARTCGPRRLQRRVRARGGHFSAAGRTRSGGGRTHGVRGGQGPRGRGLGSPGEAAAQDRGKDCRCPPREEAVSARLGTADTRIL